MSGVTTSVAVRGLGTYRARIKSMRAQCDKELRDFTRRELATSKRNVQAATPVGQDGPNPGQTRRDWKIRTTDDRTGRMFNDNPAIVFLTKGTPAHGPINGSVLRFVVGGRVIYTRWVKGIAINANLVAAIRAEPPRIRAAFRAAGARITAVTVTNTGGDDA